MYETRDRDQQHPIHATQPAAISPFATVAATILLSWWVFPAAARGAVAENSLEELATSTLSAWTETVGGPGATRSGTALTSNVQPIFYTRSIPDIDQTPFQLEAIVSASALTADGTHGARMWAKFRTAGAGLPPGARFHVEVRFARAAGVPQLQLVDATSGVVKGMLRMDGTQTTPRLRVRLKVQQIGGADHVFLQAEPSDRFDDPASPNDLNDADSVGVPLNGLEFGIVFDDSEVGFGNRLLVVGSVYFSEWESIHVTTTDSVDTVLPYWPPAPPAPTLTLDTATPPHALTAQVDLPTGGYHVDDAAMFGLDTLTGTLLGAPILDPSAPPASHSETFTGVAAGQAVDAWMAVSDVSGRTTAGPSASLAIPDAGGDRDGDGFDDDVDNCPLAWNVDQADLDGDGLGDACDPDIDGDGFDDAVDNCPLVVNPDQSDLDGDGLGDACDGDDDGDGFGDSLDNCPLAANPDQSDLDGDGLGDTCDGDDDDDGVDDAIDNCPLAANPGQLDHEADGVGDICDPDDDNDGVLDLNDNCELVANPDQSDADGDDLGNACDADDDDDGVGDNVDNCPFVANPDQADLDGDGLGDTCDADADGDGVLAGDNCPQTPNPDQVDLDGDGLGDACDGDDDGDGVDDVEDNCALEPNPFQEDADGDHIGDACDLDLDGDGLDNGADNCPLVANPGQDDLDVDGLGDLCDPDADGDGVDNVGDNCPLVANPGQSDVDGDGLGDACDDLNDSDGDGIGDELDNCPLVANPDQLDFDGDALGDACDADIDGDGVAGDFDVCSMTPHGAVVHPSTGCSIAQLCPCEGPRGRAARWPNHGRYLRCVVRASVHLYVEGLISRPEARREITNAARSDCGRRRRGDRRHWSLQPRR